MSGCNLCTDDTPGLHCWEYVRTRDGLSGWRGCHENFSDQEALRMHVAGTGGCRNPQGVDNLRFDGVHWKVKEEDERKK